MSEIDRLVAELMQSRRESTHRPTVYFVRADNGIRQAEDYLYRQGYLNGFEVRNKEISDSRVRGSNSISKNRLLEELTFDYAPNPLILSGSGNLHHYTYAFCRNLIDRRNTDYSVLDFDKHLDYKPPIARITCGNFNYELIRDSSFVKDIVIISDSSSIRKYSKDGDQVSMKDITTQNVSLNERVRNIIKELDSQYVYITLDLDCLKSGIQTDWGNGRLETDFVLRTITDVSNQKEIIGMDICGLRRSGINEQSLRTFARIFELVSTMRYSSGLTPREMAIEREIERISSGQRS